MKNVSSQKTLSENPQKSQLSQLTSQQKNTPLRSISPQFASDWLSTNIFHLEDELDKRTNEVCKLTYQNKKLQEQIQKLKNRSMMSNRNQSKSAEQKQSTAIQTNESWLDKQDLLESNCKSNALSNAPQSDSLKNQILEIEEQEPCSPEQHPSSINDQQNQKSDKNIYKEELQNFPNANQNSGKTSKNKEYENYKQDIAEQETQRSHQKENPLTHKEIKEQNNRQLHNTNNETIDIPTNQQIPNNQKQSISSKQFNNQQPQLDINRISENEKGQNQKKQDEFYQFQNQSQNLPLQSKQLNKQDRNLQNNQFSQQGKSQNRNYQEKGQDSYKQIQNTQKQGNSVELKNEQEKPSNKKRESKENLDCLDNEINQKNKMENKIQEDKLKQIQQEMMDQFQKKHLDLLKELILKSNQNIQSLQQTQIQEKANQNLNSYQQDTLDFHQELIKKANESQNTKQNKKCQAQMDQQIPISKTNNKVRKQAQASRNERKNTNEMMHNEGNVIKRHNKHSSVDQQVQPEILLDRQNQHKRQQSTIISDIMVDSPKSQMKDYQKERKQSKNGSEEIKSKYKNQEAENHQSKVQKMHQQYPNNNHYIKAQEYAFKGKLDKNEDLQDKVKIKQKQDTQMYHNYESDSQSQYMHDQQKYNNQTIYQLNQGSNKIQNQEQSQTYSHKVFYQNSSKSQDFFDKEPSQKQLIQHHQKYIQADKSNNCYENSKIQNNIHQCTNCLYRCSSQTPTNQISQPNSQKQKNHNQSKTHNRYMSAQQTLPQEFLDNRNQQNYSPSKTLELNQRRMNQEEYQHKPAALLQKNTMQTNQQNYSCQHSPTYQSHKAELRDTNQQKQIKYANQIHKEENRYYNIVEPNLISHADQVTLFQPLQGQANDYDQNHQSPSSLDDKIYKLNSTFKQFRQDFQLLKQLCEKRGIDLNENQNMINDLYPQTQNQNPFLSQRNEKQNHFSNPKSQKVKQSQFQINPNQYLNTAQQKNLFEDKQRGRVNFKSYQNLHWY